MHLTIESWPLVSPKLLVTLLMANTSISLCQVDDLFLVAIANDQA